MTKIQMPEPVAHAVKAANTGKICSLSLAGDDAAFSGVYLMEKKHVDDLITTAQAEAYADARVREALEIALAEAKRVSDKYGYGYYGSEVDAVDEVAEAIRSLIPPTKNEAEE